MCPPTLSGHWQQEIKAYAPFLSVTAYVGPPAERKAMKDALDKTDIVITSYDVCRNDIEAIEKYNWNYVVLDEGHLIKNPKAKISQAVKKLPSNHRLILTGTPIQNNVLELWSLFDFLMPGFLGAEKVFLDRLPSRLPPAATPRLLRKNKRRALSQLKRSTNRSCHSSCAVSRRRCSTISPQDPSELLLRSQRPPEETLRRLHQEGVEEDHGRSRPR